MTSVLEIIYSRPFLFGAVFGALGMKLYQLVMAHHLDKVKPLPGGRRRHVSSISTQAFGGLMALAVVGYVLVQVNQTETKYRVLADRLTSCQVTFQTAIVERAKIAAENDKLSMAQRDKLTALDQMQGVWIDRLLNPPPHIAETPLGDPRRVGYTITVTRFFQERAVTLRADIADIRAEQTRLTEDRNAHPLPDPLC